MPQKILYLDPWSGVSGDMMLAALLDAGGEPLQAVLHQAVGSLGLRGVTIDVMHDVDWGIGCTRVQVRAEQSPPLRHLADMLEAIGASTVSDRVKAQAGNAVTRLAEVEADIHGCPVDEIHFHEVGAADTLVDVVGTFALVEALEVVSVHVGTIPVGGGTVEIAHGRMGVPAPATAALLTGYVVTGGPEMKELTTPTGALLVSELHAEQGPMPPLTIRAVGYGAGTMKLKHAPNVLRASVGESNDEQTGDDGAGETVVELQTNLDDITPEVMGYTLRRLREAGALDAWAVAAQMKKDRPGTVLHALVPLAMEAEMVDLIFSETGTLGIRRLTHTRHIADRGTVTVMVAGREVRVKWGAWKGRVVSIAPEYEDAVAAASMAGLPLRQVMQTAVEAARHVLDGDRSEPTGHSAAGQPAAGGSPAGDPA
jgi:uncharacterized protein (TIGR00299 family) protein